MLSLKETAEKFGVSVQTLRRWEKNGRITFSRTIGGHRRFSEVSEAKTGNTKKKVAIYARVSTSKQRDDLERQMKSLNQLYPDAQLFSDVASGINWRRRGLRMLLKRVFSGEVGEVIVAHRDRLCRFAFPMIEWIIEQHDCKVTVIDQSIQTNEQELADDLLSIVQIFCCRKNGQRAKRSGIDLCVRCIHNSVQIVPRLPLPLAGVLTLLSTRQMLLLSGVLITPSRLLVCVFIPIATRNVLWKNL